MMPVNSDLKIEGWVWCLTPIISAFWEAGAGDHEVRRWRPSWLTRWNPISTKNTKIRSGEVAHTCSPSTLGGWSGWITRWKDWDHPEQHDESSISTKNTQISWCGGYSGGWGRKITWTWEAEVAVSWDCTAALQPGRQRDTPSQKKKKLKKFVYHVPSKAPNLFYLISLKYFFWPKLLLCL